MLSVKGRRTTYIGGSTKTTILLVFTHALRSGSHFGAELRIVGDAVKAQFSSTNIPSPLRRPFLIPVLSVYGRGWKDIRTPKRPL